MDLNACYIPFWEGAEPDEQPTVSAPQDGSLWANIAGLSYTREEAASFGQMLEQHGMNTVLRRVMVLE